jgi:hypothetical protein
MSLIPIGTKVTIVDDVGKDISFLLGKQGTVTGYKWNRIREERNLPVVQLDDGAVVGGWGLWFEVIEES